MWPIFAAAGLFAILALLLLAERLFERDRRERRRGRRALPPPDEPKA